MEYDPDLHVMAKRLRMARAAKDLRQQDAAAMTGISQSALSLYEKGRRDPMVTPLKRLAVLYDVSVDWLMGIDGAPMRRP